MNREPDLLAWIAERRILAGDGAMGTALQSASLPPGGCPEAWNLERPEVIEAVMRGYVEAGAEILETNSFGGSPEKLAAYGLSARCAEINRAAAEIGSRAAGGRALVVGSIGSTGVLLDPLGPLGHEAAFEGFRRQAEALAEGGVSAFCVETMIDLNEAILAVGAAARTGLPVMGSMTFESTPRGFFTVMGADVARSARELEAAGACVVGTNCGTGPAGMIEIVRSLRSETRLPILVQPNAGIPLLLGDRVHYPETPEGFASHVGAFVQAGASVVGGCCGTTADHIRALGEEVRRIRGS